MDDEFVCSICGCKAKKGDIFYGIDCLTMVKTTEGDIKSQIEVCNNCLPNSLRYAEWNEI